MYGPNLTQSRRPLQTRAPQRRDLPPDNFEECRTGACTNSGGSAWLSVSGRSGTPSILSPARSKNAPNAQTTRTSPPSCFQGDFFSGIHPFGSFADVILVAFKIIFPRPIVRHRCKFSRMCSPSHLSVCGYLAFSIKTPFPAGTVLAKGSSKSSRTRIVVIFEDRKPDLYFIS